MNPLSLIPFGLRISDQQYVDASEVKKGLDCECICPSCKTPLIARQGDINEWHFAHASRNVSKEIEDKCEYSFWVSVTLMAKQAIASAETITLPSLVMYKNDGEEVIVTEHTEIIIDQIKIESNIESIVADAELTIGDYSIAILFDTPNRDIERRYSLTENQENIGILIISLKDAAAWLFGNDSKGKYSATLKKRILNDNECKSWVLHPRMLKLERKHNYILQKKPPLPSKQFMNKNVTLSDIPCKLDSELRARALELTKHDFRVNKGINPDLPGWAGWAKSEAEKLFIRMKNSKQ